MVTEVPNDMTSLFVKEEGERVRQVSCGVGHTLVLTSTNKVYALGKASRG